MCENNHGHCDVTQTTTIWLEVAELVTVLTIVRVAIFTKNGVKIDVTLALLSYYSMYPNLSKCWE